MLLTVWLVGSAVSIRGGEFGGGEWVYLAVRVPPLTSRTRTLCKEVQWTRGGGDRKSGVVLVVGRLGILSAVCSDVGIYKLSASVACSRNDHWWSNPNSNCISLLGLLILLDSGTDSHAISGLHSLLYGMLLGPFESKKRASPTRIFQAWCYGYPINSLHRHYWQACMSLSSQERRTAL